MDLVFQSVAGTQEANRGFGVTLDLLAEARASLVAAGRPTLGADWRSALDSGMLDLVRAGRLDEAREVLQASLATADPPLPGSLR